MNSNWILGYQILLMSPLPIPFVLFFYPLIHAIDLNSGLQAELFSCDSLHNFVRLGYHQQPFVLITEENRQESSAKDLEVFLSRRSPNPFRLIFKDNKSKLTLSQEVNEALVEVHASHGLEKKGLRKNEGYFS